MQDSMGQLRLAAIAWRNLWRNGRRTAITLSSFADGTAALTWRQAQPDLASFITMKKGGM